MKRKMISVVAMMMAAALTLGGCGGKKRETGINTGGAGATGGQSANQTRLSAEDSGSGEDSPNLQLEEIQWTEFPALPADSDFPDKQVGYVYGELDALIEAYLESSDTFNYLPRSLEQGEDDGINVHEILNQMDNYGLTYRFLCKNDADQMSVYILAVDSVTLKGAVYPNGNWEGDRVTGHESDLPEGMRISYVGNEVEEFDLKALFPDFESRIVSNTYTEEDFMKAASEIIVPLVADAQGAFQDNSRFHAEASGTVHISPSGNEFRRSISVDLTYNAYAEIGVGADMYTGRGSASYRYPGEADEWKSGEFYLFLDSGLILEKVEADRIDENVTEYDIPDGVTDIPEYSFYGCTAEQIGIPDTVVSIGDSAFGNMKSLKEVSLPESVIALKKGAFHGCNALTKIRVSKKTLDILNYSPEEFKLYIGHTNDDLVVEVY